MTGSGVTRLLDGPAGGQTLMLRRAPMYLRVVIDAGAGRTDALDQLDDTPEPQETVHVYRRRPGTVGMVCIRPGGCYQGADYDHLADVDGEPLRDTVAWRAWAQAQPPVVAPGTLVWRWRTVRDPCRPFEVEHARWGRPRTIPHPLAHRVGEPVRELARGANGARLLEFADGFRVVAPFYSVERR